MPVEFGLARAVARAFIPSWVKLGFGANAITRELKSFGLSYRRINMLKDIRELSGLMKMEKYISKLSDIVVIPKFGLVETELNRDRYYRVFAELEVHNTTTGLNEKRTLSWYDDELKSKSQWIKEFLEEQEEGKYAENEEIVGISIRSVEHNAGWRYL